MQIWTKSSRFYDTAVESFVHSPRLENFRKSWKERSLSRSLIKQQEKKVFLKPIWIDDNCKMIASIIN